MVNQTPNAAAPAALPLRDRIVIWSGLGAITTLAWFYLARMPMAAGGEMAMAMPRAHRWTLPDAWLTFLMWAVMMVAMMLPTAAPMVLMYARIARGHAGWPAARAWLFALGYLCAWTLFSVAATAGQGALQHAGLISGALRLSPLLGGLVLVAAGLYQLTPLKEACLRQCRSPIGFFMTEWRQGAGGAFSMGLHHGTFCLGCCWMLMALLFVAGVMNLLWVAAISAFVLIEKVAPWGRAVANTAGIGLIASGLAIALLG